jgi:putative transposase
MRGGVEIHLNGYVRRFLSEADLEVRSVTLTTNLISISVRKQINSIEVTGMLGLDSNLDNVTVADSTDQFQKFDLGKVRVVRSRCRQNKRGFRRNDSKTAKRIFNKYASLESKRVDWLLHNVSASIVLRAKLNRQAIAMENLKGIRRLYRRGNGQRHYYRWRMNSWSFAELQRQIQYKADWNGVPVIYVRAFGTSAKCSICGHRVLPEENRQLHCPNCGLTVDRDVNAARNILARGLRFKPVGSAHEAMVQEPNAGFGTAAGNPESRCRSVDLEAHAGEPAGQRNPLPFRVQMNGSD